MKNNRPAGEARIVYFSHGGGPLPILGDKSHRALVDFMEQLPAQLGSPETILVISAHWEEPTATLLGAQSPSMFYDYYGFPEEAYNISYPAPGNPALANKIAAQMRNNSIPVRIDSERGYDHGVFIPLKLIFPKAEIPILQLSLLQGLDPAAHIAVGRALHQFSRENILVIGSGFSFHNMKAFSRQGLNAPDPGNDAFQDWLIEVCTGKIPGPEREQRLIGWEEAPFARYCHPREEHLMPLHVCAGMADRPAKVIFDGHILGKRGVAFLW